MTDPYANFRLDRDGPRLTLTLNRASSRNALTLPLVEDMVQAVTAATLQHEARVLVLSGDGPAFSAGADLGEYLTNVERSAADQVAGHARMSRALSAFESLPLLKVAQVHGACVGAGLVLACLCEVRVAGASARFSVPEVALGIPFSMGGYPRLARLVGVTRATSLMLSGWVMTADEAFSAGLVNRTVDDDSLGEVVDDIAASLGRLPQVLVTDAVDRIRETNEQLIPTPVRDVMGLVLASCDPDSRALAAAYTSAVGKTQRRSTKGTDQ